MSVTNSDPTIVVNTSGSDSDAVWAMAFHPDGMHLLGGGMNWLRRWRIADGEQVGEQTGMNVRAISASRDHKWIVCGTSWGVGVWDAEIQEKAIEVESTETVAAIDVSPDSTRFATARYGTSEVFVWSIITGEKLLGPLLHDKPVVGIKFSPDSSGGEHKVATICEADSIRIFDSQNGDQLIHIDSFSGIKSFVWSNDARQILAVVSKEKKIRVLDAITGSQLSESQVFSNSNGTGIGSMIAPAANGRLIAAITDPTSVSLLDTSTFAQVGSAFQDSASDSRIWSVALSADSSHLATGGYNGKIVIRSLSNILPNSSDAHGEGSDQDLLEVELPSSTPGPEFNYDQPPSPASSTNPGEVQGPPPAPTHAVQVPQPSDALPVTFPPVALPEKHVGSVKSARGFPRFKKWLKKGIWKNNKGPGMAEGRRIRRAVATSLEKPQHRPPARAGIPSGFDNIPSLSEQGPTDSNTKADPFTTHDISEPSAGRIQLTEKSGKITLSFTLPICMCLGSGTENEMH